jgi:hypothetical protein
MTAKIDGMLCTCNACEMRGFASVSILARIHEPPAELASRSRTGESCLHGSHHSAQRSRITGTWNERSSTSLWKLASVTSIT